ncbi:uncharacterized protein LOC127873785 isoform X2 [Dreissena polymorpha]|uniref:ZP domain-containing protein n=1 Tax=Dreissena polymorpha TaxID=45954 RepID=A0A9D4QY48_DREPO|nr:uncharacterized protein LOC127873785 isoform X2 [Dreissena polymorpha]KAH3847996.1 hypothetical protein DPMN_090332 [Dreissena polymorpha]
MSRHSVVFLALLAIGPALSTDHMHIDYECDSSGVMTAVNPDPEILKSATAGQGTTICNTTLSNNGSTIIISGCSKDDTVLLTLSNRETSGDGIIAGGETHTFALFCEDVDEVIFSHQVDFVVPNEISATTEEPDETVTSVTQSPVTPRFGLTTSIMNAARDAVLQQAVLGQSIVWTISGPSTYDLLPVSCFAYAGTTAGGATSVELINSLGCSAIIFFPKFVSANNAAMWEVFSPFPAFKFVVSDYVTFACDVKVCRRGSAKCSTTCGKRRRRTARAVQSSETSMISDNVRWPRELNARSVGTEDFSIVVAHLRIAESGGSRVGLSAVIILFAIGMGSIQ